MSNPIFNKLDREWTGQSQSREQMSAADPRNPYAGMAAGGTATAQAARQSLPTYNPEAFEQLQQSYDAPAADAVDRGRMTYDDVIMKTGISLGVLVIAATLSWWATGADRATMTVSPIATVLLMGGLIVGLVLAMVVIFSKTIRPALILLYAAAEGVMLGALSAVTEMYAPGVVIQAVLATFVVFAVTLLLFTSGKVRNSPKLMKFALISMLGLIGSRLLIWLFGSLGWLGADTNYNNITIMGIPLAIALSVFAVFLGAICLISDFDAAKVGVEAGAPAKYAWMCAFGLMMTLIWLYVEILNILARLNSNN